MSVSYTHLETKVTYQSSVDLSQPFAADYDYVEKKD